MEGKVRVAGCLRLELVGDAAAAVMDVAEAELAAAGAALADLAFVAVQALVARDAEFWLRRKRSRWVCGRAAPLNRWTRWFVASYVQTRMCEAI